MANADSGFQGCGPLQHMSSVPPPISATLWRRNNARQPGLVLLMNGFTSVRDLCGADPRYTTVDLRDAVAAGIIEGPRMLVAPHIVSACGGHG